MSHKDAAAPAEPTGSGPGRRRTAGAWAVVGVLLAVGIVLPLLVFVYDQETPAFIGFPFYYWFQFLLIPIVSGLTYTAFRLSLRATEKDRSTLGLPADDRPQDRGKEGD